MRQLLFYALLIISTNITAGIYPTDSVNITLTSSDKAIEQAFEWAKKTALSYTHDGCDAVGYWYEAALPAREAFCMRDVSHQSVGAQILGLSKHNKNMFYRFAENISEEKDWCTYWEINRYNQPAPADYRNDDEFWYNLNANFDVLQACLKMYRWTGDTDYLTHLVFANFYTRSIHDYIDRWQLSPEQVMARPRHMNTPTGFNTDDIFHTCRGLASYVENFHGLSVGVDLIAALYAGFNAYAQICDLTGDKRGARQAQTQAEKYQELLENRWWDQANNRYHTFWTESGEFYRGEGVPFLLWLGAPSINERINLSVEDILSKEWNVENLSYFPALLYRLGYHKAAYDILVKLPHVERAEYPEVSFGVLEGIVCGAMGITPDATTNSITTCNKSVTDTDIAVTQLPVFDGNIAVQHNGRQVSSLTNNTKETIQWTASFMGRYKKIIINGHPCKTRQHKDIHGNIITSATYIIQIGETATAQIRK